MRDLLGEVPPAMERVKPPSKRSPPGAFAYPAPPGTGPQGKTCRDCVSCVPTPTATRHYKCLKNKARWGCTNLTDIKVRMNACRLFEQMPTAPEGDQ